METKKPLSASAIISAKKKAVFRFLLLQLLLTFLISLGIFTLQAVCMGTHLFWEP